MYALFMVVLLLVFALLADAAVAADMAAAITAAKTDQDSIGGVITCVCRGVPAGWGEPVFDKLEALLAHAMLSIPATKGFEIGSGFGGTAMRGSMHNDRFYTRPDGTLGTVTNHSGGGPWPPVHTSTSIFLFGFCL